MTPNPNEGSDPTWQKVASILAILFHMSLGKALEYSSWMLGMGEVYHQCPPIARFDFAFAFHRYRHHNLCFVRNEMGEPPAIITSEEGITQGCCAPQWFVMASP